MATPARRSNCLQTRRIHHQVKYWRLNANTCIVAAIADTTGEGSRQHVLTGLTPFTSYSVQVAAVNAGGTGPYSTALTVRHCRIVSNEQIIIVALLVCVPVQFLVSVWSVSHSRSGPAHNLMDCSLRT